ncbi:MAG TPA: hypothetical protein VG146_02530 [Verrucomicrobiae bacterium]|nr:hypothetical protein [Verrucomicrobiae bacterium]
MSYPAPQVDYRREIRRILRREERVFFAFILGGVFACALILAALVLGQ